MVIPEERTLFDHPINRHTTAYFYPHKMELTEFISEIKGAIKVFEHDTGHYVKHGDYRGELKPKHLEGWAEQFLRHFEVEQAKIESVHEPRMREVEDFTREILKAI